MKSSATAFLTLAAASLLVAGIASAQTIGGHDETSEANSALWATGTPTPGTGPAPGISSHLLLSEIAVTPTPGEFIEIHNPTSQDVDLTNFYLSDAWFEPGPVGYHQLPSGTLVVGTNTDFVVRFPAGAIIPAGATQVVALYGAGIDSMYGAGTADYEVTSSSGAIPDMINVSGGPLSAGATGLTNGSEFVVLFFWDGLTDNVCDVDYVTYGPATTTSRVDKTGTAVDGPDGDSTPTPYLADTPDAAQSTVTAPGAGSSVARASGTEGVEAPGGNGCLDVATPARNSTWGQVKALYR